MLTISIDALLCERFPDLRVGAFSVERLAVASEALTSERLAVLWTTAQAECERLSITLQNLVEQPSVADWRHAISRCGLKPSTFRGSVEALVRRVLKDGSVSTPLSVVTAYCAVSATQLTPLGAYDVERLPSESILLRLAQPDTDIFEPLGARVEDMPIVSDVAVYAAGSCVISWAFNHRDSRRTCLLPNTTRAIFIGEAVAARQHDALRVALERMRALLVANGAEASETVFVDRNNASTELGSEMKTAL